MLKLKFQKSIIFIFLIVFLFLPFLSFAEKAQNENLIILSANPEEAGRIWGEINKEKIKQHLEEFLKDFKSKGLTEQDILKKAEKYNQIVKKIAPWWHRESYAVAMAVGISPELYNAFLALKYVGTPKNTDECTSYLAVGSATKDGIPILHKNRAYKQKWQAVYVKEIKIPGRKLNKFIASGDVSDLGVLMMVNEKGLAGVMNQGEPYSNPCYEGLPTPAILRYIAETASTCEEALGILKDIVRNRKGWYTNGSYGSIWLFVDKNGKGLCVENTAYDLNYKFIENGFLSRGSGRGSFGKEIKEVNKALEENKGNITSLLFNEISRIPSISLPKYISGFTAQICAQYPATLSCAWIALGRPSYSIYTPLFIGIRGVAKPLADGEIWALMKNIKPSKEYSYAELKSNYIDDAQLESDAKGLKNEAEKLIQKNKIYETEELLTNGCNYFVKRLINFLHKIKKYSVFPQDESSAQQNFLLIFMRRY